MYLYISKRATEKYVKMTLRHFKVDTVFEKCDITFYESLDLCDMIPWLVWFPALLRLLIQFNVRRR